MTDGEHTPTVGTTPAGLRGADAVWSDLLLGLRLTVRGGRSTWARVALTAFGIGLCATVLLLAASVGPAMGSRDTRAEAMTPRFIVWSNPSEVSTAGTSLDTPGAFSALDSDSPYQGRPVHGIDLSALPRNLPFAAAPPGTQRFPAPDELVLSPALRDLLASPDSEALRSRFSGEIIGTIGPEGLLDPDELRFYRGTDSSGVPPDVGTVATGWGYTDPAPAGPELAYLQVLLTAGTTIVLVPLLIFVSLMSRLGGPARDRRSAAIRLLGASRSQLGRITLMETVLASLAGLVLGTAGYLAVRLAAPSLTIGGAAFFPADIRPDPVLAGAVVLLVPILAVAAVWLGSRRITAEPLGVIREAPTARRRPRNGLLVLVVGILAMVGSLFAGASFGSSGGTTLMAVGIVSLLTSVAILLPWAVQSLVARLPTGGTAWQLAVRRLQVDPGTPSHVVAGTCVVLAGVIALQPLLVLAGSDRTGSVLDSGSPGYRVFVRVPTNPELRSVVDIIAATPGVTRVVGGVPIGGTPVDSPQPTAGSVDLSGEFVAVVAPCAAIPEVTDCRDGQVFAVDEAYRSFPGMDVKSGMRVALDGSPGTVEWTVPQIAGTITPDPLRGAFGASMIITPGALGADVNAVLQGISLDLRAASDAPSSATADQLRGALADLTWRATVTTTAEPTGTAGEIAATARTGVLLGAALTLLVAATGLLVMSLEQLTARRRSLTLTVAIGVPRRVLAGSLLIGAAIPILLGIVLAVLVGSGLAAYLLVLSEAQVRLDWTTFAGYSSTAFLLVMLATLPGVAAISRLTRLEGIRTG